MRPENRQTAHVKLRVRLLKPEQSAVNQSGDDPRQKSRFQSSPEVDLTSQPMAAKILTRTKETASDFSPDRLP